MTRLKKQLDVVLQVLMCFLFHHAPTRFSLAHSQTREQNICLLIFLCVFELLLFEQVKQKTR